MARHNASRFALRLGLTLFALGFVCRASSAWAIESDDETPITRPAVTGSATPNEDRTAPPQMQSELRIGLLEMRPNFEAERAVPETVRAKLAGDLQQTMNEINTRPKVLIPNLSVMKNLGPRERALYDTCWVDPDCLASALTAANLDTVLVGKLRFKAQDAAAVVAPNPTSIFGNTGKERALGEYTLLVRLIDLRQKRILREFVVNHTDYTRLSELAQTELRKQLVALGLLSSGESAPLAASSAESLNTPLNLDTEVLKTLARPTNSRARILKATGWTTLTLGVIGTGMGGIFGLLAKKKETDLKNNSNPGSFHNLRKQCKTYTTTANALYGTGGGLLLTSIVLLSVGYTDHGDAGSAGGVFASGDGVFFSAQTRF